MICVCVFFCVFFYFLWFYYFNNKQHQLNFPSYHVTSSLLALLVGRITQIIVDCELRLHNNVTDLTTPSLEYYLTLTRQNMATASLWRRFHSGYFSRCRRDSKEFSLNSEAYFAVVLICFLPSFWIYSQQSQCRRGHLLRAGDEFLNSQNDDVINFVTW